MDFVTEEVRPAELREGQYLVKNLMLTIDPTMRMWMTQPQGTGFVSQVPLNTVMKGGCIGQVVASRNPEWPVGAKTEGMTNWQEYCVCDGQARLKRLPPDADPAVEIGAA